MFGDDKSPRTGEISTLYTGWVRRWPLGEYATSPNQSTRHGRVSGVKSGMMKVIRYVEANVSGNHGTSKTSLRPFVGAA